MYAIVDIAGQQFKVEKDQKVFVHRLDTEVGSQVDFEKVLLIDTENSVIVGEPVIKGALVTAKVLEHLKGDKVIVFKKKRRKGYKVKNGHRQFFTKIMIEGIFEKGEKSAKPAKPKEAVKPVAEEVPVKKAKQTEKPEPESKVTATKAATTKKPAVVEKETIKKEAETKAATKKEAKPKKDTVTKKAAPAKKTEVSTAQKKTKKVDKPDKK